MIEYDYWHEHRNELREGQAFRDNQGDIVRLVGRVPGDGSKWRVDDWNNYTNAFHDEDGTLEPGDLVERLPDYDAA